MHVCMYIYTYICIYDVYVYIYIERERERAVCILCFDIVTWSRVRHGSVPKI